MRKAKGRKKVVTFFATTSLVAALSLISYFVPRENVPGRLGFLATLYLLLINLYNHPTTQAPSKIGFGYVDQWFIIVQMPVLSGLIEYGFVLVWGKYCSLIIKAKRRTNQALKYIDLITFVFSLIYLITVIIVFRFVYV